jgi:hypothetical protein
VGMSVESAVKSLERLEKFNKKLRKDGKTPMVTPEMLIQLMESSGKRK